MRGRFVLIFCFVLVLGPHNERTCSGDLSPIYSRNHEPAHTYLSIPVLSRFLPEPPPPLNISAQTPAAREQLRDGQHDFDFRFGIWHLHFRFLPEPLSGSRTWAESDGIVTVRQIWNGRASLEELEAGTPTASFEGVTRLLYNPQARQ